MDKKEINIEQYQLDFLWFTYFGITRTELNLDKESEKGKKTAMRACIQRAYLDLSRTLKYTYSTSKLEDELKNDDNKDKIEEYIGKKTNIKKMWKIVWLNR